MGKKALATMCSQSRSGSRLKKLGHILFFPFIVKYLDFWGFSVSGGKSYVPHG
jgi:hypothetical protein